MGILKTLGKIGKAIGIGIAVSAVGALAVLSGGALAPVGIALLQASTYVAGLGVLNAVTSAFIKKPKLDDSANANQAITNRQHVGVDVQANGVYVFGLAPVDIHPVYIEQFGTKDDRTLLIIHAAFHQIQSFEQFWVDDDLISFSGDTAQGDYANTLWKRAKVGTESQTHIGNSFGGGTNSLPADFLGKGVAYYGIVWRLGQEKTEHGFPTRITQEIKGALVYDPRLDSTVGGSGSHRANNQSTWQYNDGSTDIGRNLVLCVLRYILGWKINDILAGGIGADPNDIDYPQWIAMANVAEEVVDSKPRYRGGGMVDLSGDHEQVLGEFEAMLGARIGRPGGKWSIWVPHDDLTSFMTITDADIIQEIGVSFKPIEDVKEMYNVARGRYVDPGSLYQFVPYPEVRENAAVLDDGRERMLELDLGFIQDEEIAQRIARERIRRSRFQGTWIVPIWSKGLLAKELDVITLNIQETNNTDQKVRILSMKHPQDGVVILTVIEEDASIYDTTIALGTTITQNDPAGFDPSTKVAVASLAASPTTLSGTGGTATDAFDVTWDDPGTLVRETEVQYQVSGNTDWQEVSKRRVDFLDATIAPVEPGTNYDIRARHITIFGIKGAWSTLINQTAGSNTVVLDTANVGSRTATQVNTDINTALSDAAQAIIDAAGAQSTADGKITTFIQTAAPTAEGVGDLWIDSDDGNKLYRWSGSAWDNVQDNDIAQALTDASNAQATADGKVVTFYQSTTPTAEGVGDLWVNTSNEDISRWSGSAWNKIGSGDALSLTNAPAEAGATKVLGLTGNKVTQNSMNDNAVVTLKIDADAAQEIASEFISGALALTSSFQVVNDISVTIGGASVGGPWPVLIHHTSHIGHASTGQAVFRVQVVRDATVIWGPHQMRYDVDTNFALTVPDDPGAGTYTYKIEVEEFAGPTSQESEERAMTIQGIKR